METATADDGENRRRKPGGWRSMPYILGNETFERLATFGLLANFMVYLLKVFHLSQVEATKLINIWSGCTNFAPLIGAFISDAYAGRFRTIAVASFASMLGMTALTLTAWISRLHPPECIPKQPCARPTTGQLGFLIAALSLLSIGTAGIRPCSLPFGVDQFDSSTESGRRGITSFYNWYYITFTLILMISLTLIVYIQDSISWVLGFGIPTLCMLFSIVLFFFGTRVYVYVSPTGSAFSRMAQVIVAAFRKRRVRLEENAVYYDSDQPLFSKLPLTNQYTCLNKAAVLLPEEDKSNPWRLCRVQQVEELKCILGIIPVWASGIICFTAMVQQGTFTISQALKMDRHLGPKFEIPPGSLSVISMLTIGIWVPFYDRIVVPALRKITKHESGITLLQRMGIGIVFSALSMAVAGLTEQKRRGVAHVGEAPVSVLWLTPQLVLLGFAEAFNVIGQIEFYNRQFPEHLTTVGNALFSCTIAGANYLSSLVVAVVHDVSGGHDRPDWLTDDIDQGRVDYFYFLLAGMGVVNLVYFLVCSKYYRYKASMSGKEDQAVGLDMEMSHNKQ